MATSQALDWLRARGIADDEIVGVFYTGDYDYSDKHATTAPAATAAHAAANGLSNTNVWMSANVTRPAPPGKKGTEDDICRMACLWTDLDDKGMPSRDTTRAVIDELSFLLGAAPASIVDTGHGLQPAWRLANTPEMAVPNELVKMEWKARIEAWGRLVQDVVTGRGGGRVDAVYNLDRLQRCPGTINHGKPEYPERVEASLIHLDDNPTEVTVEMLEGVLSGSEAKRPAKASDAGGYFAPPFQLPEGDLKPGERNEYLFKFACSMRAQAVAPAVAVEALRGAFTRCDPPLGEGRESPEDMWARVAKTYPEGDGWTAPEIPCPPSAAAEPDPVQAGIERLRALKDRAFFKDKSGLQTKSAAEAIQKVITYGWNKQEAQFYTYANGVWSNGHDAIKAATVAMFGEKHRPALTTTVMSAMPYLPNVRVIDAEPVGADRWLNVRNGLLDWKTRTLYPHDPDNAGVIQLACAWDPDAECPTFEKFLAEVLPTDLLTPTPDCPHGFIWEVIGYALYTGNPLHKAFLCYAPGRNGKGRFLHVLEQLVGLRNVSSVGLHELVGNRFRSASLYGKLLNVAGDLDAKWLEDTALFKKFTGGDTIQAEHKFGQPFDFRPYATPFYSANEPFGSADQSVGYWDRWVVLPFPYYRGNSGRSAAAIDAENTTDAELSGILRKAVAGLTALMARGKFVEPSSAKAAKEEFRASGDKLSGWVRDHTKLDPGIAHTPRKDLYGSFKDYCVLEGVKPLAASKFYKRLELLPDVYPTVHSGDRGFSGIWLPSDRAPEREERDERDGRGYFK